MSKLRVASILLLFSTFFLKFSSMFRDIVIAHYFGASVMADVYFAAMTIPNAIILFMLTGMKDAFLPSYYKFQQLNKGLQHLTNIVKGTFIIAAIISIIGALLSPFIISVAYPTYTGESAQAAIWTSVIYFLSVMLVGVNAVYEGFFDAKKKFSFSVFSQTIVVICTIGSTVILHSHIGIYSVPIGYFIGTIMSFLLKVIYLKPAKMMNWTQKIDRQEVKAFYLIFLPVGLTIAVGQINLMVNMIFAAKFPDGVLTSLTLAFRLVNIPQAIFGVVVATIIFPILAQAKTTDNKPMFRTGIEKGLTFMFLLLAPAVAGMVVLMEPIVTVFYQRGAFDAEATLMTSQFAIFYIGSVLFYSIQAVIAKGFYTLEKGHYMLRIGLLSILFNVIFNAVLSRVMGPSGLALSTSLVGLIYSSITFITLYKLVGGFNLFTIGKEFVKIIIGTGVMTVVLLVSAPYLASLHHILYLSIMIMIGVAIYFVALYLLKVESLREILNRGRGRKVSS